MHIAKECDRGVMLLSRKKNTTEQQSSPISFITDYLTVETKATQLGIFLLRIKLWGVIKHLLIVREVEKLVYLDIIRSKCSKTEQKSRFPCANVFA